MVESVAPKASPPAGIGLRDQEEARTRPFFYRNGARCEFLRVQKKAACGSPFIRVMALLLRTHQIRPRKIRNRSASMGRFRVVGPGVHQLTSGSGFRREIWSFHMSLVSWYATAYGSLFCGSPRCYQHIYFFKPCWLASAYTPALPRHPLIFATDPGCMIDGAASDLTSKNS